MAFLVMGVYFFFIEANDLAGYPALRLLNGIILITAINEAIRHNRQTKKYGYATSIISGVKVAVFTTFLVAVSLSVYLNFVDTPTEIYASALLPTSTSLEFVGLIAIEGLGSGVLFSFLLMQYWKNIRYSHSRGFYLTKNAIKNA